MVLPKKATHILTSGVNKTTDTEHYNKTLAMKRHDTEDSRVQSLLHQRVQKEMQNLHDEEKARMAKEGSEKVIQQQMEKPEEVDHDYESPESQKMLDKDLVKEI